TQEERRRKNRRHFICTSWLVAEYFEHHIPQHATPARRSIPASQRTPAAALEGGHPGAPSGAVAYGATSPLNAVLSSMAAHRPNTPATSSSETRSSFPMGRGQTMSKTGVPSARAARTTTLTAVVASE